MIPANKVPVELLEKAFFDLKGKTFKNFGSIWKVISTNPKKKTLSLELISIEVPDEREK